MADECIKRENVIVALENLAKPYYKSRLVYDRTICAGINTALREVHRVPAADVRPVVRCEDCVHYDKGANDSESWMYCKVLAKDVYDDFYCKLGERREVQR